MTATKHFSVYDGMTRLGAIVVTGAGSETRLSARDVRGRKVGTFSTIKAAVAAIPPLRPVSRVPRKRKRGGG